MSLCDHLAAELTAKLEVTQRRSSLSFKQGAVIKFQYRADYTKVKKEKRKVNHILIINLFDASLAVYARIILRRCIIMLSVKIHTFITL